MEHNGVQNQIDKYDQLIDTDEKANPWRKDSDFSTMMLEYWDTHRQGN